MDKQINGKIDRGQFSPELQALIKLGSTVREELRKQTIEAHQFLSVLFGEDWEKADDQAIKQYMNYKIAFSGSSGSGKTTLVTWLAEQTGLQHISGSAGDVKQEVDKMIIDEALQYPGGGHVGVIRYSALNPEYGLMNQQLLQVRRHQIIQANSNFITDRSPADNMTYFINQVGYHPMVTNALAEAFFTKCVEAWQELTHVIYVKAVQPIAIEVNGSRVGNNWYQWAIDAQFEMWINKLQKASVDPPQVMIINYWDLDERKNNVLNFINHV